MMWMGWFLAAAMAGDAADARQFFDEHVAMQQAFDPAIAAHYQDDAVLTNVRDGGDERKVTGAQYKQVLPRAMPMAKERGDTATFADVKVAPHGDGFRITATRTAALKCAPGAYRLDVVEVDGAWSIAAEHVETVSLSECEPSEELAAQLKTLHDGVQPHLPMDLDADTRLEAVDVKKRALIYTQRLPRLAAAELDLSATIPMLQQVALQSVCGTAQAKAVLEQGATVRYVYLDKDGAELTTVDVYQGMCG